MTQPSPSRSTATGSTATGSMNVSTSAVEALDFLAFRYVVGELTVDESTAFEARLATDQTAREAVAAAVEVTVAIHAAGRERFVVVADRAVDEAVSNEPRGIGHRRRWGVVGAWLVAGSLACLALVAMVDRWAGRQLRDTTDSTLGGTLGGTLGDAASDSFLGQLARLWSEERPLASGDLASGDLASGDLASGDLASDSDDPLEVEGLGGAFAAGDAAGVTAADSAADAPSWMIAAVAAKSGAVADESSEASMESTAMPHVAPDAKPTAGVIP